MRRATGRDDVTLRLLALGSDPDRPDEYDPRGPARGDDDGDADAAEFDPGWDVPHPGGRPAQVGNRGGALRAVVTGAAVVCAAVAVGAGGRLWWLRSDGATVAVLPATSASAAASPGPGRPSVPSPTGTPPAAGPVGGGRGGRQLLVHVVGRVARPGLVTLSPGARVADAVAAGGGAAEGADLGSVNLARPVADGEQVRVLGQDEEPSPGPTTATGAGGSPAAFSTPVDLNSADAAALDALPGVGPVTASRIIEHRTTHGRFASVDDLAEVPGIGERTLERLRPLVRV